MEHPGKNHRDQKSQRDEKANKESVTRRRLLQAASAGVILTPLVEHEAYKRAMGPPHAEIDYEAQRKSIANYETPEASYKILYSRHDRMSTPELLDDTDALVHEAIYDYSVEPRLQSAMSRVISGENKNFLPDRELILRAAKDRKPLFFIDMLSNPRGYRKGTEEEKGLAAMETIIGGLIMIRLLEPTNDERTRRGFLEISGKAMLAGLSAYLASRAPEHVATLIATDLSRTTPDETGIARKAEKILKDINHAIHPETRTLEVDTRNTLFAQKATVVARMLASELGRKPRIAMDVGYSHAGVEKKLRAPEEQRVKELKEAFRESPRLVAFIARVDWREENGNIVPDVKILADPTLAQ